MTITYLQNYLRLCKSFNFKRGAARTLRLCEVNFIKYLTKMANTLFDNVGEIVVNTGNILSLNDITKKSGQNTTEEV